MKFEVREARLHDCGKLSRMIRATHRAEAEKFHSNLHADLQARYFESAFCRSLFIDDRLAAMGGVIGPELATAGYVWVALSQEATKYPLSITKEAKRQLAIIMNTRRELITTVMGGDDDALRFAVFLGFHVSQGDGGDEAFSKEGRVRLTNYIKNNADLRIPVHDGFVIRMGYHPE